MLIPLPFFIILGWLVGVLINHAANVLPRKESLFQVPFCQRRLSGAGQEFISTALKGAGPENPAEPADQVCHTPKSRLAWSALVAYLTGRQVCPGCGRAIGLRSLVVEVLTAALFGFLALRYPLSAYLLFLLLYTTILILLTVTDLEHRLIQNVVILPAVLLAIGGSWVAPNFGWRRAILGGALGLIVFYLLALVSRGGLGSGDVTLATFLGLITALPNVILVILFGILLGGIVSALLVVTRRVTLKTFIPYGPFLIVIGWIVLIWGDAIFAHLWG